MVEAVDARLRPSLKERIVLVGSSEISQDEREEAAYSHHLDNVLAWAEVLGSVDDMIVVRGQLDIDRLHTEFEGKKTQLTHPEYSDVLLRELSLEMHSQQRALSSFRKMAGLPETKSDVNEWDATEYNKIGEYIYRYITGKKPKEPVVLVPTPLAVSILVKNSDDLHRLYGTKKTIGGFFTDSCYSKAKKKEFPNIAPFPFIAVLDERSLPHELGHARFEIDQKVLNQQKYPNLHLLNRDISEKSIKIQRKYFTKLVKTWIQTKDPTVYEQMRKNGKLTPDSVMRYWLNHANEDALPWLDAFVNEQIIPVALSRARNEILADYKSEKYLGYDASVRKIHGLYNKVNELFWYVIQGARSIPKGNDTSQEFITESNYNAWHRYEAIVHKWNFKAWELRSVYDDIGLSKRVEYFAHILEQIPCSVSPQVGDDRIARQINNHFRAFAYERIKARSFEGLLAQHGEMERFLDYLDGKKESANAIEIDEFKKKAKVFRTKPEDIQTLRTLVTQGSEMKTVIQQELDTHQMESLIPIFNTYEDALREWITESAYLMEDSVIRTGKGKASKKQK